MAIQRTTGNGVPHYVRLHESGELRRRADAAVAGLERCQTCPWECGVDRLQDETKMCRIGRYARVASYAPHLGEEDCLRGWNGSGTIFFGGCNLRCVFCQNYDISQGAAGVEVGPERLAEMMLELQGLGCHNINWVTPEHVVPQILEALPLAVEDGLRIPLVYNTSAFDSLESLRWMDGVVDIYMPDFKYWVEESAKRYLKCPLYPDAARAAFREMHRQVGVLATDESGLARKGVLVRHLVMPGAIEETRAILAFLADELSRDTYVNLMAQYHPDGRVSSREYPEINRRVSASEMAQAIAAARAAGLHRLDQRRPLGISWKSESL
jgi:putative pyruvate formate lyase activating enzyme